MNELAKHLAELDPAILEDAQLRIGAVIRESLPGSAELTEEQRESLSRRTSEFLMRAAEELHGR